MVFSIVNCADQPHLRRRRAFHKNAVLTCCYLVLFLSVLWAIPCGAILLLVPNYDAGLVNAVFYMWLFGCALNSGFGVFLFGATMLGVAAAGHARHMPPSLNAVPSVPVPLAITRTSFAHARLAA